MMRRAKGALAPARGDRQAADRAHRRDLQRLFFAQRRQNARKPAGEHGLAGARRAAK